ncbi:ATP synthase subunit I [Chloracidobacterium sp. MS 40/45]|uniref:ATP synthase subunit I n=1 Tax=Chloracidobacterium aggregatum TaxID=2851959 RepID=UPI001B8CA543|nr:ATP synthase subunit I [Chloracidobacterium aggregatum]QUW00771.1 ATP synthase subunit I [Chloracidobacterium sp. MS 40/45]
MAAASERPCDPSPLSPEATERRVRRLTLVITCGMAVGAGLVWEAGVGAGVAIGGGLAYLNFVWMRASLQSIVAAATAGDAGPSRRPSRFEMAKFFLRWIVIGAVIWLSIQVASVLVVAIVCGLFALPLAVVVEALVHVWYGLNDEPVM